MFGINNEMICFTRNGSHFWNDCSENFENKSIVNIVSNSLVIVGVIAYSDIKNVQEAFPLWRKKMKKLNAYTQKLSKRCLEQYIRSLHVENTFID
jgi:hypothetical protein